MFEAIGDGLPFRILHPVESHAASNFERIAGTTVAVLDVETTGLDRERDAIVELAVRRLRCTPEGEILAFDVQHVWLEEPPEPLSPEIVRLTGLTDDDLIGRRIDDEAATALLLSADVVVAHNASFDRPFVESRLPAVRVLPWACSCHEVDWVAAGMQGRALGWLLMQAGFYHRGHRAGADVDAVCALLGARRPDGRTFLAELIERASAPTFRYSAVGAPFAAKDRLKGRGYRWDAKRRVWWREIGPDAREAENEWLAANVYEGDGWGDECGPVMREVTWEARHRW